MNNKSRYEKEVSFPRFVVGNLPLSRSLLKEEKQPYFMKKVEDPRTLRAAKHSGMTTYFYNDYRGFTLIELLVVVLIIGILAAVAFPKYQAAVDKASLSCIRPVLKTLTDAQQTAALARGDYPPEGSYFTFDDLDVDVQTKNEACKSTNTCRAMCANKEFEIVLRNTETWANFWWTGTNTLGRLRCVNKDTLYYLLQCSSARCKRIAKALGGKFAYGDETTENYVL